MRSQKLKRALVLGLLMAMLFACAQVGGTTPQPGATGHTQGPESIDLSPLQQRQYEGRPTYDPAFYLDSGPRIYPVWMIEVEGNTYLFTWGNIRACPVTPGAGLEGTGRE
jgi:hypothetical protein